MLDYKITKKHYPRTNNSSVLEFVFEKDPIAYLSDNIKSNDLLIQNDNSSVECDTEVYVNCLKSVQSHAP